MRVAGWEFPQTYKAARHGTVFNVRRIEQMPQRMTPCCASCYQGGAWRVFGQKRATHGMSLKRLNTVNRGCLLFGVYWNPRKKRTARLYQWRITKGNDEYLPTVEDHSFGGGEQIARLTPNPQTII